MRTTRFLCLGLGLIPAVVGCSDPVVTVADAASDLGADARTDAARDAAVKYDDIPSSDAPVPVVPRDRARFPLGATYWLPAGTDWRLDRGPDGNRNAVFTDAASSRQAFVPHVAGEHRFVNGTGTAVTVRAIDATTLGFQNHNYFPTRAVAAAGDLVWVASVLRPEILAVDRMTLRTTASIPVGAWPVAIAPMRDNQLLVAARGEDTLTVVDLATRRAVRSVWVGDEVGNVIVTSDGRTAIAAAPTDRKVVFIDLMGFTVLGSVSVGVDPLHLALSPDGSKVYVAGRRTGPGRADAAMDPDGDDLSEIDVASRRVTRSVHDVGTTLGGLVVSPDGRRLIVSAMRNNPAGTSLSNESARPFRHQLIAYDLSAATITLALERDVTRSVPGVVAPIPEPPGDGGVPATDAGADGGVEPSTGVPVAPLGQRRLVGINGLGMAGNDLWVASEATDMVLRFAADTLIEQERFEAPGRPRAVLPSPDGGAYVFGHQSQQLTAIERSGTALRARTTEALAQDPRPAAVAEGQRVFTGPGARAVVYGSIIAGDTWSCSSCHADGTSDKVTWQAGPVPTARNPSRAFTMLEATAPLGWEAYMSTAENFAYTTTVNIGLVRPSQSEVDSLSAYLTSIMPPPAANSLTERDGSFSAAALRGRNIFAARCASCHEGPLTTNGDYLSHAIGVGGADTPSLLGAYRQSLFFHGGDAHTLSAAVSEMVFFVNANLSDTQQQDLTRYVGELTGREFFASTASPAAGGPIATTSTFEVSFSQPVFRDATNLARVKLLDGMGRELAVMRTVEGRKVTLTPMAALGFDSAVRVVIEAGLESDTESRTTEAREFSWRTVHSPTLRLDGTYALSYAPPPFGPPGIPLMRQTVNLTLTSDAGGRVQIAARYPAAAFVWRGAGTLDGSTLRLPPMPVSVFASFADAHTGFAATLQDTNADGIADTAAAGTGDGGTRTYAITGPGFNFPGLEWSLARTP